MVLELPEYAIETNEAFTVAGVAERGTDIDAASLWADLRDFDTDVHDVAASDERYGVIFETDVDSEEYTYLVGHAVESTDDLPPEMAAVEVPEATFAVFSLRRVDLDEVVEGINEGMLAGEEHDQREGPVFQRYAVTETPTDPDASFELFVPVEEE